MWYLFENELPIQPESPCAHNRLDDIPDKVIQDLCDYINNISTRNGKGLLRPKITLKDLRLLLTSGNCEDNYSYSCNNIVKLSFIFKKLADEDKGKGGAVLDKHNYQKVICSHDKLLRLGRKHGTTANPAEPITPKDLSKSAWEAKEKSDVYEEIISKIREIFSGFWKLE